MPGSVLTNKYAEGYPGRFYHAEAYGVNPETFRIDPEIIRPRTFDGAKILAERLLADDVKANGIFVLTGGTDVHLVMVDLRNSEMDGQQGEDLRLGGAAAHALQNAVVDVLEGDVDVVEHLRFTGDDVDEGVVQIVGVQVVQANPVKGQLAQLGEQLPQHPLVVEINAVAGDVLGDDDELLHPARPGSWPPPAGTPWYGCGSGPAAWE